MESVLMGTLPDPSCSLSKGSQHSQSAAPCPLQRPMQQQAFFHLLTTGHLQEVGKMCANQAIENLLGLGHHPRNPILVAQQGSF